MSEKCLRYWLLGCSEFSAASTSLIYFTCQFEGFHDLRLTLKPSPELALEPLSERDSFERSGIVVFGLTEGWKTDERGLS